MTNNLQKAGYGVRFVAILLIAGGLLGLTGSTLGIYQAAKHHQIATAISGILAIGLFAWSLRSGVSLWRFKRDALRPAQILFAMQIPVFSLARFSYEFSTFFSFRVMVGNTTHHIGGNIGSSSNIGLLSQPTDFLVGINIIALLVFLYLLRVSARERSVRKVHPEGRGVIADTMQLQGS